MGCWELMSVYTRRKGEWKHVKELHQTGFRMTLGPHFREMRSLTLLDQKFTAIFLPGGYLSLQNPRRTIFITLKRV